MVNSTRSRLTEDYTGEEKLDEAVKMHLHSDQDLYSFYVEQVDDPGTMFELNKFGKTYGYIQVPNQASNLDHLGTFDGLTNSVFNFRLKSADVDVYQADDFVHACLEDNVSRFPETVDLFYEAKNVELEGNKTDRDNYIFPIITDDKFITYEAFKIMGDCSCGNVLFHSL